LVDRIGLFMTLIAWPVVHIGTVARSSGEARFVARAFVA
jgi:hypothetical protein